MEYKDNIEQPIIEKLDAIEEAIDKATSKKNGFTLIELLAVIIILGILILIAIPSVTRYINDSRKETYIDTARQYIKSAAHLVNEGKQDFFDTEATYFIPVKCLKVESGGDSPYGKFDKAFVLVTYDNESYKYYWISRDVAGQGIKVATLGNDLNPDQIVAGIKSEDIKTNVTVEGKPKAVLMNESTCELGKADSFSQVVNDNNIQDDITYPDDPNHTDDGYTVILAPDYDFSRLPDFTVYNPETHASAGTFKNLVRNIPVEVIYGYMFYVDSNNHMKVKLIYNLPTFKKNSDGSIHTVKRFISRLDRKYLSADGSKTPISYACATSDINAHVVDCDIIPSDFVPTRCNTTTNYCINGDGTGTSYVYFELDNGDVLEGWKSGKYSGGSVFTRGSKQNATFIVQFSYVFTNDK